LAVRSCFSDATHHCLESAPKTAHEKRAQSIAVAPLRNLYLRPGRARTTTEAFNLLNHRNVVGFSGTYGNGAAPGNGFGVPLAGVTNQLPARELQFSAQIEF
jgi:hypothetical protein